MKRGTIYVSLLMAIGLNFLAIKTQASAFELDFSFTITSTTGTGNSQPGLVPGAAVSGSYRWNTQDFHLVTSYNGYGGLITIYDDPFAILNYTSIYGGMSYSYQGGDIEPTITFGGAGANSKFQLYGGGYFLLDKDVYNYTGGSSLNDFFVEIGKGLTDGGGFVTIGDGNWGNSVNGSLGSLSVVDEPSEIAISVTGLLAFSIFRIRSWSNSQHPTLIPQLLIQ